MLARDGLVRQGQVRKCQSLWPKQSVAWIAGLLALAVVPNQTMSVCVSRWWTGRGLDGQAQTASSFQLKLELLCRYLYVHTYMCTLYVCAYEGPVTPLKLTVDQSLGSRCSKCHGIRLGPRGQLAVGQLLTLVWCLEVCGFRVGRRQDLSG